MFNKFFPKIDSFMGCVEKYGLAGQATDYYRIRRMRFSCCIGKARKYSNTLKIFNDQFFPTAKVVTRTRFIVTLYYIAFLVKQKIWLLALRKGNDAGLQE